MVGMSDTSLFRSARTGADGDEMFAADGTVRPTYRALHDALAGLDEAALVPLFAAFLDFLRRNLNGQTTLATHPGWATQSEVVSGFARFGAPDMIVREDRMAEDLGFLSRAAGIDAAPPAPAPLPDLLDDAGRTLPLRPADDRQPYLLLARSGGHPMSVLGEWNGQHFLISSPFESAGNA